MKYSRLIAHLESAKAYSKLSKAKRLKVGAVLVRDDRLVSVGYNGTISGGSNQCEVLIKEPDSPIAEWVTKPEVVHAEMNAIAFAAKNGVSTKECSMVITDSPCFECAKLILQAGVKEVFYGREYRDNSGVLFLKEYIDVGQIPEENEWQVEKSTSKTTSLTSKPDEVGLKQRLEKIMKRLKIQLKR